MTKGVRNYQFSSSVDIAPQSESGTFGANLEFPKGIPWRRSSARTTSMDDLGFSMPNSSSAPPKVVQGCDLRMRSKPTENPSLSTLRVQVECFAS